VRGSALYDRALCKREMGQADEARSDLDHYLALFPNGALAAQASCALAQLDAAAGSLKEAAAGFERSLNLKPDAALACEAAFRLGRCREQLADTTAAMRAYGEASRCPQASQPYRLSALARLAALHESRHEITRAIEAYRDIVQHSTDQELTAAATERVSKLSAAQNRR
jgi:tetratricopeptide (TPR) repeat protein